MYSAFFGDFVNNVGDTTLRLNGFGYGTCETPSSKANSNGRVTLTSGPDDACKLVLGLGPTPSVYSDEYSHSPSVGNTGTSTSAVLDHGPSPQRDSILKLSPSSGIHAVSDMLDSSASTRRNEIPIVDEGSTSAKKSDGYMTGLILAPRMENSEMFRSQIAHPSSEPSAVSTYSEPGSAVVSPDRKISSNVKKCNFPGCTKGARGATGQCIGHGGGQRCLRPGCYKGAESQTAFCKAHGGGRRCQHLGCTKSAEGKTNHCIAHGGGRRCGHPSGCTRAARGRSGLCIRHGGGKRCQIEGCSRSAEGQIGLCISHGGGRRCQFAGGCTKGAQGSTVFCKAHGGGKRCIFAGCMKGAEGSTPLCKGHGGGKRCMHDGGGMCPKSVHGGTNFCVAHGGGKRCAVPGCTKSARGRTDCCVRHGGGKRCKSEHCGKSAQGSTDFCKAHGGGKRCEWADGKCEKFARGKSGLCAAHASMVRGQETKRGGNGMIGPGLFRGLVPDCSTAFENTCLSSGVSVESDSSGLAERKQLIPAQVLVPLSMKVSSFWEKGSGSGSEKQVESGKRLGFVVPEGRVHGGGLLSLLGGNLNNAIDHIHGI